jgi:hypothetical protein
MNGGAERQLLSAVRQLHTATFLAIEPKDRSLNHEPDESDRLAKRLTARGLGE